MIEELKKQLKILKIKRASYKKVQNEGQEGYNPFDYRIHRIASKICDLNYDKIVTIERRKLWNDWVSSFEGKKISNEEVVKKQNQLGWTLDELKKSIKVHNL